MSKTAILPIVTILAGAYTVVFKEAVSADTVDLIATIAATVIGAGISIWGVIKNHKKVTK